MEKMNLHPDLSTISDFLKMHPVVSFVTGIAMMLSAGYTSIYDLSIPTIFMQVGQLIAWIFIYSTGAITIVGFLEKTFGFKLKLKFFKKKNKE